MQKKCQGRRDMCLLQLGCAWVSAAIAIRISVDVCRCPMSLVMPMSAYWDGERNLNRHAHVHTNTCFHELVILT